MHAKLDVDQINLLELFSSIEYFADMRDKWQKMIKHVEDCLTSYMSNLPLSYRSKPLPDQPDIVWGHRVLPNFRHTLQGLNEGFVLLTHGDTAGLGYAHSVRSDYKCQLDYWPIDWMHSEDQKKYEDNIYSALLMAHAICFTEKADWPDLKTSVYAQELELIHSRIAPCSYRINSTKCINSGEKVEVQGIYLPSLANGCLQFLGTHLKCAPLTSVCVRTEDIFDPQTGEKYDEHKVFEGRKCTWYLVEKTEDSPMLQSDFDERAHHRIRIASGELCVQTGYYFTPHY